MNQQEFNQLKKEMDYTDKILDIVYNRDEFSTSDLQGAVQAIVHTILKEAKK
jgi:hypothetical protein